MRAKEIMFSTHLLKMLMMHQSARPFAMRSNLPEDLRILRVYQEPHEVNVFRVVCESEEWPELQDGERPPILADIQWEEVEDDD